MPQKGKTWQVAGVEQKGQAKSKDVQMPASSTLIFSTKFFSLLPLFPHLLNLA